jgi:hypothetical protein
MKVLSGIIGLIVPLLTKARPDGSADAKGSTSRKSTIRPDNSLIRVVVRNQNFAWRNS